MEADGGHEDHEKAVKRQQRRRSVNLSTHGKILFIRLIYVVQADLTEQQRERLARTLPSEG